MTHGPATDGEPLLLTVRVAPPVARARHDRLHALLLLIATLAVAMPALLVAITPHVVPRRLSLAIPRRVIPRDELPPVEPVAIQDLTRDEARAYNADVPFTTDPIPPARPFGVRLVGDDLARATDCLAAGVWYEAGDDAVGERAVARVVLNRIRHPAFPKTVCGVVFQGSERRTGCQFSFTCDGLMDRHHPSDAAWARAIDVARLALAGSVYAPVGWATHYHTDWVVPYWQASLDKLVEVHTQLFYRWSGWWGTPPAFNRRYTPGEPTIDKMAALSPAHRVVPPIAVAAGDLVALDTGATGDEDILAALPPGVAPDLYPSLAVRACGDRARCRYMAWADRARVPPALPLAPAQVATMGFSYARDRDTGLERSLWNCRESPRRLPAQCMKQQVLLTAPAIPDDVEPSVPAPRPSPTPTPAATPAR